MAKSGHKAGGGIASKVHKEIGYRQGTPRRSVNPTGVHQLGAMQGSHITGDGESLKEHKVVRPLYDGAGYPSRLGNDVALSTDCRPGGSRTLYGKSGSQMQHGSANPGMAPAKNKDILSSYGPDYRAKGSR